MESRNRSLAVGWGDCSKSSDVTTNRQFVILHIKCEQACMENMGLTEIRDRCENNLDNKLMSCKFGMRKWLSNRLSWSRQPQRLPELALITRVGFQQTKCCWQSGHENPLA